MPGRRKERRQDIIMFYIYLKLIISVEEVWGKENWMQMLAEIVSALTMREPSGFYEHCVFLIDGILL